MEKIQISIDKDIYDYLLKQINSFDENESDVLRRVLKIKKSEYLYGDKNAHELENVLSSIEIQKAGTAVSKFLILLSAIYQQRKEAFKLVLEIKGRGRAYFGTSKNDIMSSGKSTQPKKIPNSPFWVMTNSPTSLKRDLIKNVLQTLDYSLAAIEAAIDVF